MDVRRGVLALGAALALALPLAVPAQAAGPAALPAAVPAAVVPAAAVAPAAARAAALGEVTVLTTGQRLYPGDSLVSPSGRFRLRVLTDGWERVEAASWLAPARTTRSDLPLRYVTLQADGNLVYVPVSGVPFGSGTEGSGATSVRLRDDGRLSFRDAAGRSVAELGGWQGSLDRGQTLLPGDTLTGQDGTSRLVMQTDGNLVLYRGSVALWSSRTSGRPGAGAVFQTDGNLVVYSSAATGRTALFSTRTSGAFADSRVQTRPPLVAPYPVQDARLVVEPTSFSLQRVVGVCCRIPRFTVADALPETAWASDWTSARVVSGDVMDAGDRRTSPDGRCVLRMQGDRNLVLYCDGAAVWASGVPRVLTDDEWYYARTLVQRDGNVVIYQLGDQDDGERAGWNTGTRVAGSSLVVQDDRNLVVYGPTGRPTWSRLTGRLG